MSNRSKPQRHANQRKPKKRQPSQAVATRDLAAPRPVQSQPNLPIDFGMTAQRVQITQTAYQGPIPDPATLAEYEERFPGLAARIVTMAEKEQDHRHSIVTKVVDSNIGITKRGQWFGFLIAVLGIVGGVLAMIYAPNAWAAVGGGVLGGGSLIGLVGLFVSGNRDKDAAEEKPQPKKRRR